VEHEGAWQGFTTNISRYVDDKLTVVVLTNLEGSHPDEITHHVAGLYERELMPEVKAPEQKKP
jgi:hypothetical protein